MRGDGTGAASGQGSGRRGTPAAARGGHRCIVLPYKQKSQFQPVTDKIKGHRDEGKHLASMRRDGARPAGGQGSMRSGTLAAVRGYHVLQAHRNTETDGAVSEFQQYIRLPSTGISYLYYLPKFQHLYIIRINTFKNKTYWVPCTCITVQPRHGTVVVNKCQTWPVIDIIQGLTGRP